MAVPSGLTNALVIIADNMVHLAINAAALAWRGWRRWLPDAATALR